ncbi:YhjD/YihY/BrkB family envelope integrity protein [Amycolatopsis endophytica]|uniref:Membrane protein n=1 Tax=Amycolatopsis endophytica TaxID=860233 RepID=A0A853B889_9PSEU|nr:YihY/virulence factor BrkB family protein [Amycolatopsis endophytica]NYI91528.1 membrane protein [Amycolatopsis endophytica]
MPVPAPRPPRIRRSLRRVLLTLTRYRERDGDHYAAAVTFFTLLSVVPLLMIAVSVAGFVLAGDRELTAQLDRVLANTFPAAIGDEARGVVAVVIAERGKLGLVALAACLYSGWSWISNLRDAVTALLGQPRGARPLLRTALADLATLAGIGGALLVSCLLASLTGTAGIWLLTLTGLADTAGAHLALVAGSVLLSLTANWLVVAWCLASLPRERCPLAPGLRPAAVAAIGLGALQQAGGLYLHLLGRSPAVATLGALVGALLFVYLTVRWLLLVTVWTTTAGPRQDTSPAGDVRRASGTLAAGASAGVALRTLSGR